MELKNYTKTAKFQMLFVAMGIKKLTNPPEVKFHKEIVTEVKREYVDPQDKELLDRLNIGGMSFDFKDINVADDEPLEINNHKICVYIRDQKRNVDIYAKKSKYRYHLCNCRTLQGMRRLGRHHRYVATRRKDGYFEVVDLGSYQKLNGIIKLKLCMNCIAILQRKGMYNNPFSLS